MIAVEDSDEQRRGIADSEEVESTAERLEDAALSSGTDEEVDDEEDDENERSEPVEYLGSVIPDPDVQEIEADSDLAREYGSDSEYIDLIHLKIQSLDDLDLARFTKLQSLCLRQNLVTSMTGVKDLPETMENLDFYDNRINHISSNISKLVNLKSLDLSFNKIKNIKNVGALTQLENLYFVQNRIREIKNLETLKKLKNLELGGNKIEEINEGLHQLTSLTQLWLGKNRIHKLQNLSSLTNLRVLSIQSNRITKIEGLEMLVNLEELYLSHNGISKIENLDNNKNLQVLDMTSNRLTSLDNMSHLTKLTDFWCSFNQISDFQQIRRELGNLPELDTVYFEGNPIQRENPPAYRRKLRLNLGPSLTKIDATYVTS